MLYIKKESTNRFLFYKSQFTPDETKKIIFKTTKETNPSEVKYWATPNITYRDSYTIYEFTEVALSAETVTQGLVNYAEGGFYSFEIYEEDAFTTNPTTPVLYTERIYVDLFEQPTESQTIVSPSNRIIDNTSPYSNRYTSGATLETGSIYIYNNNLFEYVGTGGTATDFMTQYTAGDFQIVGNIQTYVLATEYFVDQTLYSNGNLYRVIADYTSTGNIATDITNGNLLAITASGGSGGDFLPLSGGTMSAQANINGVENLEFVVDDATSGGSTILSLKPDAGSASGAQLRYNIAGSETSLTINRGDNFISFPSVLIDSSFIGFQGAKYGADYSTSYVTRSLVDKGYVDTAIANAGGVARQTFILSDLTEITGSTTSAATVGDVAIITNDNTSYILQNTPPTDINNWVEILSPDSVVSVNGQTGVVNLTPADILPTTSEDWIIVSDGFGGFKESNVDVNEIPSQNYIDTNFLSLNGGTMNLGASILNSDGSGTETILDAYNLYLQSGGNTNILTPNGMQLNNGFESFLQQNTGATQNTVISMPLNSGTLVTNTDIDGFYLKTDGTGYMDGNLDIK